jgi:tetratricopeptide (TPR) repeat protein
MPAKSIRFYLILASLLIRSQVARADDFDLCNHTSLDPSAGIPACTRLIEREGGSSNIPGFYNNRGIGKIRIGDIANAIDDFSSALNRNPKFSDAYKNRGIARQMSGDYDRAIADFNQGLRFDPNSAALLNARGSALFSKEEYDRAVIDFNSAIALDKNYIKAYVNRGLANVFRRKLDLAIADFDQVVRLAPTDPTGYLNRAAAKIDENNLESAVSDLSEAIRLSPNASGGYTRRGEAWRLKGDLAKAMQDHDKAIELERTAEAFNNRALVWKDQNQLDRAIADFSEALLIDPKFFLAYVNRGETWRTQGRLEQALNDLNKAVSLDPKSPIALSYRGAVLRDRGDLKQSVADYNEALKNVPDFVLAYVGRGLTQEKLGNIANARTDFEKALALTPDADGSLARPARELAGVRLTAIAEAELAKAKAAEESSISKAGAIESEKAEADKSVRLAARQRAQSEEKAREKATAEARAKEELQARLNAEVEARVKEQVDRRAAVAAAAAEARVNAEAQARAAANARELAEAEAKVKADIEAKANAKLEERLRAEIRAHEQQAALREAAKLAADRLRLTKERGVRIALVIGNSNYQAVPVLPNPKKDADAVAASFTKLGFQTVVSEGDLTRSQFLNKLRQFEDIAATSDWAVIYFAGHGLEMDGTNYLLPIDVQLKADRDVQDEAISLDRVLHATERARKLHLVILDSCRDNPFLVKMKKTMASRSIGRGLARIEPDGGTLVAYAAREGQISRDGNGEHSPFTTAFLKHVEDPNLEINMLFRRVRDDVLEETQRLQEPFTYGSLPGADFYFSLK